MKLDHLVYFTRDDPHSIVIQQRAKGHQAVAGG